MKKVMLFGLGPIGIEYTKIFTDMGYSVLPVGRSTTGCDTFEEATKLSAVRWDSLELENIDIPDIAIVAVGEAQLGSVTNTLIQRGFKRILVEKPGGSSYDEIEQLSKLATEHGCDVRVGYNRRFYSSVIRGLEIIKADGGVRTFHFDFSEWSHTIEPLEKEEGVKDRWFIHNSSHIVDMSFYLGGWPTELTSISDKPMSWHSAGAFVGMGRTDSGAMFTYNSDWVGPGRWGVEIVTASHRLIYRPLEKLQIQEVGTVRTNVEEVDDSLDQKYKPGFYKQVEAFLTQDSSLPTIQEQCEHLLTYRKICPNQ